MVASTGTVVDGQRNYNAFIIHVKRNSKISFAYETIKVFGSNLYIADMMIFQVNPGIMQQAGRYFRNKQREIS